MNPTLTLEMVERNGRVCYVDPSGKEVYVVSAEAYQRYLRWAKSQDERQGACEHVWTARPVGGTNLVRLECQRCGQVSYGHSGEGHEKA